MLHNIVSIDFVQDGRNEYCSRDKPLIVAMYLLWMMVEDIGNPSLSKLLLWKMLMNFRL